MDCNFPVILSRLRKSRGLSQKQVANDLKISQALLSHYERGIRECGLDFVLKAANYYNVSCDYLLGLSAEQKPTSDSKEFVIKRQKDKEEIKEKIEEIRKSLEKAEKYINDNF